ELDDICVSHPDTSVAVGQADFVLMFCSVNVNKTITGVGIVRLQPIQPENARQDEILRRWQRIVRFERDAADEDRTGWHGLPNFIGHAKLAQGSSMAAFFASEAKARSRHRI